MLRGKAMECVSLMGTYPLTLSCPLTLSHLLTLCQPCTVFSSLLSLFLSLYFCFIHMHSYYRVALAVGKEKFAADAPLVLEEFAATQSMSSLSMSISLAVTIPIYRLDQSLPLSFLRRFLSASRGVGYRAGERKRERARERGAQ
jgi:hypothetical protein